jgi:hypothetical protein
MKILVKYSAVIWSVLFLMCASSCEDMLETKNFTDMSPSNFFKSEGDIDAAVTGLYIPCTTTWGYSDGGTGKWYVSIFNADLRAYYPSSLVCTDEYRPYSTYAFDEFTIGPAEGATLPSTYNIIRFVARATDVINQIGQSGGATVDIRNRYIAEAKILRAFYMFTLYDWFGPVNVKLDPSTLMDNTITPRPAKEEYIGYIERDLNESIETAALPVKYNDDASNWGRMSKSVAYALLMKLYMQEKQWAKAKEAAEKVMGMGYSIIPSYEDVFNVACTAEHIWSIPSNTASDNYYITEVLPGDFKRGYNHLGHSYIRGNDNSYLGGWQAYCMRWEFYDTFEDNDVRKATILDSYVNNNGMLKDRNSGMIGAIPVKFTDTQYADYGIQKAQPIIRYAEVLLSYAEAVNELNGPTHEAIAAVKQITDRAGVSIPQGVTVDKDTFRRYLLAERGRELFGEGQRRQDLIRHGEFIKRAVERGNNAKDYQVLFPLPQAVIIESAGIITQNPGYPN